jgi:hypothetical protein
MAHYFKESDADTPDVELKVGRYTRIPLLEWTPDYSSGTDPYIWCYVNIAYALKPWFLEGRIRFRLIRDQTDPPDATALRNRTLARESCAVNDTVKLATVSPQVSWCDNFWWTGKVIKGRKMWAEIDSDDCFDHLTLGSRYIKVEKWVEAD